VPAAQIWMATSKAIKIGSLMKSGARDAGSIHDRNWEPKEYLRDGRIYDRADDGRLYALLYGRSKLASTAWPIFHHDRRHTGRKP
jgi:hypothetical protein